MEEGEDGWEWFGAGVVGQERHCVCDLNGKRREFRDLLECRRGILLLSLLSLLSRLPSRLFSSIRCSRTSRNGGSSCCRLGLDNFVDNGRTERRGRVFPVISSLVLPLLLSSYKLETNETITLTCRCFGGVNLTRQVFYLASSSIILFLQSLHVFYLGLD